MPADPILTLAWLVLAHLVADFVIQTGPIVAAKNSPGTRGWLGLLAHGLGVGVCLVPVALAFGVPGLWALLVITIGHALIDRTKILLTRRVERRAVAAANQRHEGRPPAAGLGRAWTPLPALYFAVDQLAHLAVSFAAWAIWLSGQPPTAEWATFFGNLLAGRDLAAVHDAALFAAVIASLLIANVRAGALFVAILVRPNELGAEIGALAGAPEPGPDVTAATPPAAGRAWDIRLGPIAGRVEEDPPPAAAAPVREADSATPPPAQVGATIGVLERLLIATFVLAGAEVAIGLVVAAKTIARFRLLDDRDFAEYYLLGTLGSVSVAIVTGLIAKAALAA
jgi:uncharacterized protein DUF3307